MGLESIDRDVVIIGAGPAGLAASIALSRAGFRVMVVDHAQGPIDKACGEGLMPDSAAALERLGVSLPADCALKFRGIRFLQGTICAEALFSNGSGLGIRRTALHEILMKHAVQAGTEILWETRVAGIKPGEVALRGRCIRCRLMVGADGQNSLVRRWAGLDGRRVERVRYGYRQHFEITPWTDLVEVYWGDGFQVVVTPVSANLVCVALVSADPGLRPGDALAAVPELSKRLKNASATDREKGAASVVRVLRSVSCSGLALIGDASGSVDSLTGEGLGLAFKQALSLAEAVSRGKLSLYTAAHRRIAAVPTLMSGLLTAMDRRPLVRRRVLALFAREPQIFTRLLQFHVRDSC